MTDQKPESFEEKALRQARWNFHSAPRRPFQSAISMQDSSNQIWAEKFEIMEMKSASTQALAASALVAATAMNVYMLGLAIVIAILSVVFALTARRLEKTWKAASAVRMVSMFVPGMVLDTADDYIEGRIETFEKDREEYRES